MNVKFDSIWKQFDDSIVSQSNFNVTLINVVRSILHTGLLSWIVWVLHILYVTCTDTAIIRTELKLSFWYFLVTGANYCDINLKFL